MNNSSSSMNEKKRNSKSSKSRRSTKTQKSKFTHEKNSNLQRQRIREAWSSMQEHGKWTAIPNLLISGDVPPNALRIYCYIAKLRPDDHPLFERICKDLRLSRAVAAREIAWLCTRNILLREYLPTSKCQIVIYHIPQICFWDIEGAQENYPEIKGCAINRRAFNKSKAESDAHHSLRSQSISRAVQHLTLLKTEKVPTTPENQNDHESSLGHDFRHDDQSQVSSYSELSSNSDEPKNQNSYQTFSGHAFGHDDQSPVSSHSELSLKAPVSSYSELSSVQNMNFPPSVSARNHMSGSSLYKGVKTLNTKTHPSIDGWNSRARANTEESIQLGVGDVRSLSCRVELLFASEYFPHKANDAWMRRKIEIFNLDVVMDFIEWSRAFVSREYPERIAWVDTHFDKLWQAYQIDMKNSEREI